jgi:hypothetical protein
MASERDATPSCFAQVSICLIILRGMRTPTNGSLPLAARPRPRFLCTTFSDLVAIFTVLRIFRTPERLVKNRVILGRVVQETSAPPPSFAERGLSWNPRRVM